MGAVEARMLLAAQKAASIATACFVDAHDSPTLATAPRPGAVSRHADTLGADVCGIVTRPFVSVQIPLISKYS